MKPVIAIDFDNTIHDAVDGWRDGEIYGEPIKGVKSCLETLSRDYKLIVFTAREKTDFGKVNDWLKEHGLNQYFTEVTNIKPKEAVLFIDDRAMNFSGNWKETVNGVKKMKLFGKSIKIELSKATKGNDPGQMSLFGKPVKINTDQIDLFTGQTNTDGKQLLPSKNNPGVRRWQGKKEKQDIPDNAGELLYGKPKDSEPTSKQDDKKLADIEARNKPEPSSDIAKYWDKVSIDRKREIVKELKWVAGKDNHLSGLGERIAKTNWNDLSEAAQGVIKRHATKIMGDNSEPTAKQEAKDHSGTFDKIKSGEIDTAKELGESIKADHIKKDDPFPGSDESKLKAIEERNPEIKTGLIKDPSSDPKINKFLEGVEAKLKELAKDKKEMFVYHLNDIIPYSLSGDYNKDTRQAIMQALTGEKTPKAKSGITAIRDIVQKHYEKLTEKQ